MNRPVRVLLDVNVLVANIIACDRGHRGTANQMLVSMISHNRWGFADKSQLVISFQMVETLEAVLRRMQVATASIEAYSGSLIDIMRYGPDALDPYLILGGEERFAMSDVEDAGVLAAAFGAKADLLVTDNLKDFATKDAAAIDTQVVRTISAGERTLQAFRYEIGNTDLVVAHPFDVLRWIRLGYDFTPKNLWSAIREPGATPSH
jgi:predicted nucleic acid-binding protein